MKTSTSFSFQMRESRSVRLGFDVGLLDAECDIKVVVVPEKGGAGFEETRDPADEIHEAAGPWRPAPARFFQVPVDGEPVSGPETGIARQLALVHDHMPIEAQDNTATRGGQCPSGPFFALNCNLSDFPNVETDEREEREKTARLRRDRFDILRRPVPLRISGHPGLGTLIRRTLFRLFRLEGRIGPVEEHLLELEGLGIRLDRADHLGQKVGIQGQGQLAELLFPAAPYPL